MKRKGFSFRKSFLAREHFKDIKTKDSRFKKEKG